MSKKHIIALAKTLENHIRLARKCQTEYLEAFSFANGFNYENKAAESALVIAAQLVQGNKSTHHIARFKDIVEVFSPYYILKAEQLVLKLKLQKLPDGAKLFYVIEALDLLKKLSRYQNISVDTLISTSMYFDMFNIDDSLKSSGKGKLIALYQNIWLKESENKEIEPLSGCFLNKWNNVQKQYLVYGFNSPRLNSSVSSLEMYFNCYSKYYSREKVLTVMSLSFTSSSFDLDKAYFYVMDYLEQSVNLNSKCDDVEGELMYAEMILNSLK